MLEALMGQPEAAGWQALKPGGSAGDGMDRADGIAGGSRRQAVEQPICTGDA
ncbi:hypothetical protein ACU4GD_34035 [Cupriavidus basilensis]